MMDNANRTGGMNFHSTVYTILSNTMSISDRK